jgi:hypothetical protein
MARSFQQGQLNLMGSLFGLTSGSGFPQGPQFVS